MKKESLKEGGSGASSAQSPPKRKAQSRAIGDKNVDEHGQSVLHEYHAGMVCVPILAMWASGALFLSQMPSDPEALAISSTWNPCIHVSLTTATVVHGALQLIAFISCNQLKKRRLVLIPLAIDLLPMMFSILHQFGLSPVYLDSQGRVFAPIRYLSWCCTTSMLIYLQWLTSESRLVTTLLTTLAWDITMLLTGIWALFATSETAFYFAAGVACYAEYIVLEQQHSIYAESLACYRHLQHTASALRNVYIISTASWIMFPSIFFAAQYDFISHNTEEMLWCLSDFAAKMCQSIALYQGVLTTVEDRNSQSMEAARDQMLQQIMLMKDREQSGTMHIANVSHELRTPLNGIIGLSDALITDHELRQDDDEAIHCLKAIRDSGARLNMLVNNMLDNAELTQQEIKMEFGPVKLQDCLNEVTMLLAPMVSSKVMLKMDVPDSLPPMRGNRDRLVQVYFNLIGNAVKFCRQGSITIAAYTRKRDMIVEVRDTGPGISKDQMKKLFTPFGRGSMPLETKLGSTGLGLCLVEALVQTHGGSVKAVSEPNVLTVFTTTIPLYNPKWRRSNEDGGGPVEEPPARREVIIRAPSHSSAKQAVQKRGEAEILSVDDDPMNHMVLRNILKQTSYRVIEADCGEQALQILQERYESGKLDALPSLILMDVMMPGLNGFQTTERIRELFPEALLPIIMISATASEDSICRGFRAGCNDYISKPIKRKDLLARISQKLGITHRVKQHLISREHEDSDNLIELTPAPSGSEVVDPMTVVAIAISNLGDLMDTCPSERLQPTVSDFFKQLHSIRTSCRFCALCVLGDFYAVGIGHQGDEMTPAEQVQASLTLATLVMRTVEVSRRESGVELEVEVSIHIGKMVCVPLVKSSLGYVYMGEALRETVMRPRYAGCIVTSDSVRELVGKEGGAAWPMAELPPESDKGQRRWVVQDGTRW
eukprot:CAMPEP_0177782826 /NCGR_PEP_ID=MMETSP0491_2-20121128/18733_1 /TAXON_ID=63592 /ORGANISM="Tetraselmis chuii, Strain PLY429" /LENGTH=940 /DNA_ID=CAMNT_0019303269 /DNA_START=191 /DNA_END=3010 /DNA_ORIENTATION=-